MEGEKGGNRRRRRRKIEKIKIMSFGVPWRVIDDQCPVYLSALIRSFPTMPSSLTIALTIASFCLKHYVIWNCTENGTYNTNTAFFGVMPCPTLNSNPFTWTCLLSFAVIHNQNRQEYSKVFALSLCLIPCMTTRTLSSSHCPC